jgi:hypothetical protein
MVTIQVSKLIEFVAEVFAQSESSPEESRRIEIPRYVDCIRATRPVDAVLTPGETRAVDTAREVGVGAASIQRAVN